MFKTKLCYIAFLLTFQDAVEILKKKDNTCDCSIGCINPVSTYLISFWYSCFLIPLTGKLIELSSYIHYPILTVSSLHRTNWCRVYESCDTVVENGYTCISAEDSRLTSHACTNVIDTYFKTLIYKWNRS